MCIYHVQCLLHVNALLMGGENLKFLYVHYTEDVHKCLETGVWYACSRLLLNVLSEGTVVVYRV